MLQIHVLILLTLISLGVSNLSYATEEKRTVKIVNSSSWPPFSFVGENGQPKGILYDLWVEIGHQQSIDIEFITTDWSSTLDLMRTSEAEVHAGLFQSNERREYLDFSIPIRIPIATRLFVAKDHNIAGLYDLGTTKVGVIRGGFSEGFIHQNYANVVTESFPGTTALLDAALAGEVDVFASDYTAAMYYLHKNNAPTAFRAVETLYMERLRAAVPKGDLAQLALVNKALSELPEEDFDRIVNKWIQSDNQLPSWVLPSFILFVVLMVLMFVALYICILKRQVQRKTNELQTLSETDALTGLYNRQKFESIFETRLQRYQGYKETFSLILIDVDNFKHINDSYGHVIGDKILLALANVLKKTTDRNAMVARWGGDEFTVLLPNASIDVALETANQIQQQFAEEQSSELESCTTSIGITQVLSGDEADDMFIRADEALYSSKNSGKNAITCLPA